MGMSMKTKVCTIFIPILIQALSSSKGSSWQEEHEYPPRDPDIHQPIYDDIEPSPSYNIDAVMQEGKDDPEVCLSIVVSS